MKTSSRMKAAQKGKQRYQGAICKRDATHGTERYTSSGQCVQCLNMASKKRVDEIRDTLRANVTP